jgi:hypothetical protein
MNERVETGPRTSLYKLEGFPEDYIGTNGVEIGPETFALRLEHVDADWEEEPYRAHVGFGRVAAGSTTIVNLGNELNLGGKEDPFGQVVVLGGMEKLLLGYVAPDPRHTINRDAKGDPMRTRLGNPMDRTSTQYILVDSLSEVPHAEPFLTLHGVRDTRFAQGLDGMFQPFGRVKSDMNPAAGRGAITYTRKVRDPSELTQGMVETSTILPVPLDVNVHRIGATNAHSMYYTHPVTGEVREGFLLDCHIRTDYVSAEDRTIVPSDTETFDYDAFVVGVDVEPDRTPGELLVPHYVLSSSDFPGSEDLSTRKKPGMRVVFLTNTRQLPDGTYQLTAGVDDAKLGRAYLRPDQMPPWLVKLNDSPLMR